MENTRRFGTATRHIRIYNSIDYSPTGSIDHDGAIVTAPELKGRQSVGFAWNGFEALVTVGFNCNLKTVSHDVDLTIGWLNDPQQGFTTRQFSIKSQFRSVEGATT